MGKLKMRLKARSPSFSTQETAFTDESLLVDSLGISLAFIDLHLSVA